MNLREAKAYIQNYKSNGISLGLERMRTLCSYLGNPEKKLQFIHIAGTNGKGSTAAYISSILGVNGCLVGRYVSPVVFQYEECIQFEDARGITYIDENLLAEVVTELAEAIERMERDNCELPTIFEFETAMAFLAFAKKECQIVVLEVGLGGREDATNVIENVIASVITPISKDHTGILGDTISQIAMEKAGIIRPDTPVITYQKEQEALQVIQTVCEQKKSRLYVVEKEDMQTLQMDLQGCLFSYQNENYRTKMIGSYQIENACLAIETCKWLGEKFQLDEVQRMLGIREAKWRGRFEIVNWEPIIVVDGAHNESGAMGLRESLEALFAGKKIHGIMGVFRDKAYKDMIEQLKTVFCDMLTISAPTERGLPAKDLAMAWKKAGLENVLAADNVTDALKRSLENAKSDEVIVLFGSLSLLRELKWR